MSNMGIRDLCELREAKGKGLGLFATKHIPRGTRILDEVPIIIIPRSGSMSSMVLRIFLDLKVADKKAFMALAGIEAPRVVTSCETSSLSSNGEGSLRLFGPPLGSTRGASHSPHLLDSKAAPDETTSDSASDATTDTTMNSAASFTSRPESESFEAIEAGTNEDQASLDFETFEIESHGHESCADNEPASNHEPDTEPVTPMGTPDSDIGESPNTAPEVDAESPVTKPHATPRNEDDSNPPGHRVDTTYRAADIIKIFQTNALGCEIGNNMLTAAVCVDAARLNHSCIPNVFCSYNPSTKTHTVHAIKDVSAGDELLNSYIAGSYLSAAERRVSLANWGFECACPACSGRVEGSEDRRRRLGVLWREAGEAKARFARGALTRERAADAAEGLAEMVSLMEEEGLVHGELADL